MPLYSKLIADLLFLMCIFDLIGRGGWDISEETICGGLDGGVPDSVFNKKIGAYS